MGDEALTICNIFKNNTKTPYIHSIIDKLRATKYTEIVFLCIGTDSVMGDTLGCLVGSKLKEGYSTEEGLFIYGDLESPSHAKNLKERYERIKEMHPTALLITIDATISTNVTKTRWGDVCINYNGINPGSAFETCNLGYIGDIGIVGCVLELTDWETSYTMLRLSKVRLKHIMQLRDVIVDVCGDIIKEFKIHHEDLENNSTSYPLFKKSSII